MDHHFGPAGLYLCSSPGMPITPHLHAHIPISCQFPGHAWQPCLLPIPNLRSTSCSFLKIQKRSAFYGHSGISSHGKQMVSSQLSCFGFGNWVPLKDIFFLIVLLLHMLWFLLHTSGFWFLPNHFLYLIYAPLFTSIGSLQHPPLLYCILTTTLWSRWLRICLSSKITKQVSLAK